MGKRLPQMLCKCLERSPWAKCRPLDSLSLVTADQTHAARSEMVTMAMQGWAAPEDRAVRLAPVDQVEVDRPAVRGAVVLAGHVVEVAADAALKLGNKESPHFGERSV